MTRGLGGEDPFARRQAAADKFLPPPPPPDDEDEDQPKPPRGKASNNASNSDSVGKNLDAKEKPVGSTAVEESAPPPPTREPEGRTQMNARVRVNRMKALKKYQHQHRATLQAVVDQMVDEYLERRGLLPPED